MDNIILVTRVTCPEIVTAAACSYYTISRFNKFFFLTLNQVKSCFIHLDKLKCTRRSFALEFEEIRCVRCART